MRYNLQFSISTHIRGKRLRNSKSVYTLLRLCSVAETGNSVSTVLKQLSIHHQMNFSIVCFVYEIFAIKRFIGSSFACTFDNKSIKVIDSSFFNNIKAYLLIILALVNSVRIKSKKRSKAKVYLIVYLVASLVAMSRNTSLL